MAVDGRVLVHFFSNAGVVPFATQWYPAGSTDLAPPGTKVISLEVDEKWLIALTHGSRLDYRGDDGNFFNATIMDVRTKLGTKEVI